MALVVVVALLLIRDDRERAEPPALASGQPSAAAASAALRDFVDAVERGDAGAARDAAPGEDGEAAELLAGLAGNAAKLSLTDFSARYVDQVGTVSADGSWTAVAELTWRFARFDRGPARTEVLVQLTGTGADTGIVRFGGGEPASGRRTPLWLQAPLEVVRDRQRLVLVDGTPAHARRVARQVRAGIGVVRRTLAQWQPRVVVEVPASGDDLDEALGADAGTYAGIAAVTAPVDGTTGGRAPTHVFVNPDVVDGLRPLGSQVVISHELTHLATNAATSTVDEWLLEGFADYVALRDVALPDRTTLARAITLAEESGVPSHLPGPAEFDTRAADLQAAYEQAWLACRVVVDRLGERGLLDLYRAAQGGVPVPSALRQAGLPQVELVEAWRDRLQDLAG